MVIRSVNFFTNTCSQKHFQKVDRVLSHCKIRQYATPRVCIQRVSSMMKVYNFEHLLRRTYTAAKAVVVLAVMYVRLHVDQHKAQHRHLVAPYCCRQLRKALRFTRPIADDSAETLAVALRSSRGQTSSSSHKASL